MHLIKDTLSVYNTLQVAFPVGVNKDSYSISSILRQNVDTLEFSSRHKVIKNWTSPAYDPNIKWKEGTRFRETLLVGTYKECEQLIVDIVAAEGEWVYDAKSNYVLNNPVGA